MTGEQYLILAYTAGLGLLLSYAAGLWMTARSIRKTEQREAAAKSLKDLRTGGVL